MNITIKISEAELRNLKACITREPASIQEREKIRDDAAIVYHRLAAAFFNHQDTKAQSQILWTE